MAGTTPTQLPAFIQLRYEENGVFGRMRTDAANAAKGAQQEFDRAFQDISQTVSRALSIKRNDLGSLDLGVDELRSAQKAHEARAIAAQEAAKAVRLAAEAEGDYSQRARMAVAAAEALSVEERNAARAAMAQADAAEQVQIQLNKNKSATDAIVLATRAGTTANHMAVSSHRAVRVAMLQSGQQMQDLAISIYSGQRASVVFAQQLPQLAFALTGLEGHTNKTYDKIGKFATFLSGPWGLAVGLGVGALATLATQFVMAGDEAEDAEDKTLSLSDAFRTLESSTREALRALEDYNKEQARGRDNADYMIKVHLDQAEAKLKNAIATRELLQAELQRAEQALRDQPMIFDAEGAQSYQAGTAYALRQAQAAVDANASRIDTLAETARNLRIEEAMRQAEAAVDPLKAINVQYDDMRDKAIAAAAGNDALSKSLTATLTAIEKQRKKALDAQKELNRATNSSGLKGREIDLNAALSIAKAAGFDVTSGYRSRAKQQWLYDNKRTPDNPVAKPGTSAHERSNALDIAFGPGITAQAIKKAYADEGVTLTKILKERGHYHIEWSTKGADKAIREAERLKEFGDRSAESIARINERFDEQPRLVDQAAAATRKLDDIITDLEERQPPGFEQLIADAEKAKGVVEDALVRPFRELVEDSQRRLHIQTLLAQGREDEADAVTEIWRREDRIGDLTATQKDDVRDLIRYEKQRSRELERQRYLFEAQLDVIDQARSSLTDLLSGRSTNFFKDMKQAFMDLQGKRLFDSLFGDMFQQLEDELRGQSPLGKESAKLAGEMHVATDATGDLVDAFRYGANAIRDAAASARASTGTGTAFDAAFAGYGTGRVAANDNGYIDANGDIVVTRAKGSGQAGEIVIAHRSVTDLADGVAGAMVSPLEEALGSVFGTGFAQMLGGVLKGALSGYLTGGAPGGILGGLKGIVDGTGIFGGADGGLSSLLGKGIGGATTGTQTAGIMKSLGIKTSTTGAQIGGTIGSFLPIPGGEILGSAVGGLLGGLFKKTKWARVLLGSGGNQLQSNSGKYEDAVTAAGDSFNQALANIADALGGSLGNYGGITLGVRHGDWRVNTGGTSLKKKKGAVDFDGDQEAAMKYAIMQAIDRGAIAGIRASTQRLLKAGNDLDAALQDALDWENVFKELKAYKDPVGAALDDLDRQFEKLIDLGQKAGASAEEMAQLEELYGIKRNEIIKEQAERLIGSLKDLYSDLTTGDNGLSLRDRRANALSEYDALKARVDAGDTTAYDDYAAAARNLLDIERQLYGSQQEYFDRLNEVTGTTKGRIDAETNVISIAENRDSPFDSAGRVNTSINNQTDALTSRLDAVNSNLGAILAAIANGNSIPSLSGLDFASNY